MRPVAKNWIEHLMERDPSPSGFTAVTQINTPVLTTDDLCSLIANYPDLRASLYATGLLPVEVARDPLGDGLAVVTYQAVRLPRMNGKAAA